MVLERILSIFVIMAIGFAAKRTKAVDAGFLKGLSAFLMNIALPFAFIAGLDRSIPKSVLPELGRMLIYSILIHGAEILFATLAYKRFPEGQRKILSFVTVFTNCAFMGLPVAQGMAGNKGLMFASMYNILYVVLIYTYGIALFQGKAETGSWKKVLFNPGIIAVAVGLVLWFLPFSLPAFLLQSMDLMAKLQTPLAMFVVGASMADMSLKGFKAGKALATAAGIRLILAPLAVFGLFRLLGIQGTAASIALVLTAMPAAAQSVVMAERYEQDAAFASQVVLVTTLLSVFTIPLFAALPF